MYLTLSEAEDIQKKRLGTEIWDQISDNTIKEAALEEAERLLNVYIVWKLETDELNQIIEETIPSPVKKGVVALAQFLIEEENIEDDDMEGLESMSVGPIDIKRFRSAGKKKNPIPDSIVSYLYPYGYRKKMKTRRILVRC